MNWYCWGGASTTVRDCVNVFFFHLFVGRDRGVLLGGDQEEVVLVRGRIIGRLLPLIAEDRNAARALELLCRWPGACGALIRRVAYPWPFLAYGSLAPKAPRMVFSNSSILGRLLS